MFFAPMPFASSIIKTAPCGAVQSKLMMAVYSLIKRIRRANQIQTTQPVCSKKLARLVVQGVSAIHEQVELRGYMPVHFCVHQQFAFYVACAAVGGRVRVIILSVCSQVVAIHIYIDFSVRRVIQVITTVKAGGVLMCAG